MSVYSDLYYNFQVGSDVKLLSMVKSVDDEESTIWYAQVSILDPEFTRRGP